MARMMSRPKTVTVFYRGIPYELDLEACRVALVERQVHGGLDSMEALANAVEISRSTASRFFSGRATSLGVTLKILEVLHLDFDAVAKRKPGAGDDSATSADDGAGAHPKPRPRPAGSEDSAGRRPEGATTP